MNDYLNMNIHSQRISKTMEINHRCFFIHLYQTSMIQYPISIAGYQLLSITTLSLPAPYQNK